MNEPLSIEENYKLMDSSDKIEECMLCNYPSAVYIAIDEVNHIVAAGSYNECSPNSVYHKAVSRGCLSPYICMASRILTPEAIKEHNNLLTKFSKKINKHTLKELVE
ncbi:MAG: hypothetical protein NTZ83_06160 [Candidatus Pacearchaeota archaeon]|nr:hypothetical protein [Candidatus Pacearchaeota archaeon]